MERHLQEKIVERRNILRFYSDFSLALLVPERQPRLLSGYSKQTAPFFIDVGAHCPQKLRESIKVRHLGSIAPPFSALPLDAIDILWGIVKFEGDAALRPLQPPKDFLDQLLPLLRQTGASSNEEITVMIF